MRVDKARKLWTQFTSDQRLVVLLPIVVALLFTTILHLNKAYISDDVALANLASRMRTGDFSAIYVGEDSFVFKLPIYLLFDSLGASPERILFFSNAIFMVGATLLIYLLLLKVTRASSKAANTLCALIATLWLVCSSTPLYEVLLNGTTRNVEIPLALLGVYYLVDRLRGENHIRRSSIIYFGLIAVGAGLLAFHDMFLIYFILLPLVALQVLLFIMDPTKKIAIRTLYSMLILATAVIVKAGVAVIAGMFHIYITPDKPSANLVDLGSIAATLSQSFKSILAILALDVSGQRLISLATVLALLTALPFIIVVIHYRLPRQKKLSLSFSSYVLVALLMNIVGLSVIDYAGPTPARYFVVVCFLIAICLAITVQKIPKLWQYVILGVVITLGLLNLGLLGLHIRSVQSLRSELPYDNYTTINRQNEDTYQLITQLRSEGVTRGYADYWQANLLQFLSDNKVTVDSLGCTQLHEARPFDLWHAKRKNTTGYSGSFLLIDARVPSYINDNCLHEDTILSQFGEPYKKIQVRNDLSVWFYSYDLGTKLAD